MAPVRDLLALILCCTLGVVWVAYMLARIWRREPLSELDWAILPAGTAALLGAVHAPAGTRTYGGRHRTPKE